MSWTNLFGNPVQKRPEPLEEIAQNSRPHVLILTPDYTTIAEALQSLREIYNVSVVRDFQEASKRMEETDFHLILTPVRLNGHTSTDVVRTVKEISPYSKVLVLGSENEADRVIAAESLSEGALKQVRGPYDKGSIEAEVISAIGRSPPFPIVVGGHFCVGKNKFSEAFVVSLNKPTNLAELLIPDKSREPRAFERVGVDYKRISPEELRKGISEGTILPYRHGEEENGLPLSFLDTLKAGRNVVIPTEINALMVLKDYFRENNVGYRLLSFLLHCQETHARDRLFERERFTPRHVKEIADDLNKLAREAEYYREHAGEFRHVLRNDNIPGVSWESAISRLVGRALEILRRESSPRYGNLSDASFREIYVEEQLGFIFGPEYKDTLDNIRRGKPHPIPFDKSELEDYSARYGTPIEIVRAASDRKVVAVARSYGTYVLGLNPFPEGLTIEQSELYKRILLNLLETKLGAPQYREEAINFTPHPHRFSLTRPNLAYQDFYISFGLYDPPKAPPSADTSLHSLAILGLSNYGRNVTLVPIEHSLASKVVLNNGR